MGNASRVIKARICKVCNTIKVTDAAGMRDHVANTCFERNRKPLSITVKNLNHTALILASRGMKYSGGIK